MADEPRLEAGTIGLRHALSQGFIANGPLASVTVAVTGAAVFGLGALPLAFMLGSVLILFSVNTLYQFSRHVLSAGGIYAFTRAGFGERSGFATGITYGLSNLLLVVGNAMIAPRLVEFAMASAGVAVPSGAPVAVALVTILVPYGITCLRLRPSLDYGIVTALLEVLAVVVLSVVFVVGAGSANTVAVFDPANALDGWSGLATGMVLASVALGGSDNVVALGEESRAPARTIKRGVLAVQLWVIGIYLLASYALTVGWGPDRMASFAESGSPLLVLVERAAGPWPVVMVMLLALNSIVGVNVAVNISTARLIFDTARRGLTPARLAGVHARHRTPVAALTVAVLVQLAVLLAATAAWGLTTGFVVVVAAGGAGFVLVQLVNTAALISFARRHDLRGAWYRGVPAVGCVLTVYLLYTSVVPVEMPRSIGVLAMLAVFAGCAGWAAVRVRSGRASEQPELHVQT